MAAPGADEVNETDWSPFATENDCCTCGAEFQFPFPGWFALTVHVPTATKLITPPAIEQTELDDGSIVSVTARPEVAVPDGVCVGPPTFAVPGAGEVNATVWLPFVTWKDCCTCGAAFQFVSPP